MWAVPAGLVAMRALWRVGVPYDVWCLGSDIWRYGRQPATRWLVRRVLVRAANTFADGYGLAAEVTALAHRPCGFLPSARLLPENVTAAAAAVPGRANLLYIGRWHPNKGADLLPAMMRELKTLGVDAHLHVFGGGILEADLRRAVAQAGVVEHVSLYGYADAQTAVAWLRACDALIIPSRIESVPVILADAVQSGIPVVAADVGDMGMLVRRHKIGRAVAPESPRALAAGVQAVLAAPRAAFAGGLREAAAVFNVGAAVDAYLAAVRTCPRNPEPQ
jgi:glycosyltransferase involved in cell wall biosynthesis